MAKIFIDLDAKSTDPAAVAAEIAAITQAFPALTLKVDMDGDDVILEGEFAVTAAEPDPQWNQLANVPPITRVVEVNHKYTYLLYVDDHGNVNPGAKVVVEAQHGGHWEGKVNFVWPSMEEYMEDHDHEPSLVVQEVIDPGPAVTLH